LIPLDHGSQGLGLAQARIAKCILRDAGLSEAETLAAMIEWNQANAEPPWTVKELLHKVQDVFSKLRP